MAENENYKKTYIQIIVIIVIFLIIILLQNYFMAKRSSEKTENKSYIDEHYFFQRTYPDTCFDYHAWKNAHSEAKAHFKRNRNKSSQNWLEEGPRNINGRVNTILVHPDSSEIIYIGSASGGIFKTTDGGINWQAVFDDQPYLAIGDLTFHPKNRQILYAGTGDPNISGYPFVGNGIYKSTDAGINWEIIGLNNVGVISEIIIHPENPDTMWVSTMGIPFFQTNDRGVYKTIDGGQTWTNVLFLTNNSGIIDMEINPENPDVLYAAGWNRLRNYYTSIVYGQQSKIYKSTDGGVNWVLLSNGLPTNSMSRIGISISQQDTSLLYASYIATDFQLWNIYKTENSGASWSQTNNKPPSNMMGGFGWYFGNIKINPFNTDNVFILGVNLYSTNDGGDTWNTVGPVGGLENFHVDKHDLIFIDSLSMLCATDGGLYKSVDGGVNWSDIDFTFSTQFYRVAADPFNSGTYGGGLQDNGTVTGNYQNNAGWTRIYGGDGFQILYDYNNSEVVYAEMQNGSLAVIQNGSSQYFGYGINNADRRSWDMPFAMSNVFSSTLYCGTYRVYRITNAPSNNSWTAISGDLTNGVNTTNHVITTIDDSPFNSYYIYAGTSDGKVWRSLDNGATWVNITDTLPNRYVTCIKAGTSQMNSVYVSHSGYKSGDYKSHIHRSNDNGNSWEDISGDLPKYAVNDILILPDGNESYIFLATDGGVYYTENAGLSWNRLGNNMPWVTVYDIDYEENTNTIIAGSFGRGMFSIDISSLLNITSITEFKENKIEIIYNSRSKQLHIASEDNEEEFVLNIFDSSGKLLDKAFLKAKQFYCLSHIKSQFLIVNCTDGINTESKRIFKN